MPEVSRFQRLLECSTTQRRHSLIDTAYVVAMRSHESNGQRYTKISEYLHTIAAKAGSIMKSNLDLVNDCDRLIDCHDQS